MQHDQVLAQHTSLIAVARLSGDLLAVIVVSISIFSCPYVIGFVIDSSLPKQHLTARLGIGTIALMWIGFLTFASFQGNAFVGLFNQAPYYLLINMRF